jgi:hypothetical protein
VKRNPTSAPFPAKFAAAPTPVTAALPEEFDRLAHLARPFDKHRHDTSATEIATSEVIRFPVAIAG